MSAIESFDALETPWAGLLSAASVERHVGLSWLSGLGFNRMVPVDLLVDLLGLGITDFLWREDLPSAVLDHAVVHPERAVRANLAEAGHRLSTEQWEQLIAHSPEAGLRDYANERLAASRRPHRGRGVEGPPHADAAPPTTPREISALAAEVPDIDPRSQTYALWWVGALHDNADAMRQLAHSPKLLVRRSVARAAHLPSDVVELLAHDDDRIVRLFLAESCDDAPPAMLLEGAAWWDPSLSFPGRPRNHPNFPRDGLLRFAADPNPRLRALALDDPASTAELVDELSRDQDATVRRSAAEDRRLTAEAVLRLAADADSSVRVRAWINAAMPAGELITLLLNKRSAEFAVHNPTIPVPVMRHMVALATPWLDSLRRRQADPAAFGSSPVVTSAPPS